MWFCFDDMYPLHRLQMQWIIIQCICDRITKTVSVPSANLLECHRMFDTFLFASTIQPHPHHHRSPCIQQRYDVFERARVHVMFQSCVLLISNLVRIAFLFREPTANRNEWNVWRSCCRFMIYLHLNTIDTIRIWFFIMFREFWSMTTKMTAATTTEMVLIACECE